MMAKMLEVLQQLHQQQSAERLRAQELAVLDRVLGQQQEGGPPSNSHLQQQMDALLGQVGRFARLAVCLYACILVASLMGLA